MRKENSSNAINEQALQQFCQAAKTVALFSGRWKLSILFKVLENDSSYSDFKLLLPGISDRTLSKQLKELQQDGLIENTKTKISSMYVASEKCRKLKPILLSLSAFKE